MENKYANQPCRTMNQPKTNTLLPWEELEARLNLKPSAGRAEKMAKRGVGRYRFKHKNGQKIEGTLEEIARTLGIHHTTICKIARGRFAKHRAPRTEAQKRSCGWACAKRLPDRPVYASFTWLNKLEVKGYSGTRKGCQAARIWDKSNLIIARYKAGDGSVKIARDLFGNVNRKVEIGKMLRDLGLIVSGREANSPRNGTPAERVWRNMRRRLYGHGSELAKASPVEVMGCTPEELVAKLEAQFSEGMTWDNYGLRGWHIDHRNPCAAFNLKDSKEAAKCFHHSNLRPLWALDNMRKGSKLAA